MTIKEIRAEVERLKDIQSSPIALCNDLISFIDSLPEEPISEDLGEASIKDFKSNKEDLLSFRDYHAGYLDGAKWQKSNLWHDAQGELEKAAKEYCGDGPEWQPDRGLFVAGANWQRKQVINKACEWLEKNLLNYWSQSCTDSDKFINDFKQAMEV